MLVHTIPARSERLEARISPEQKALIQKAADLEGRTMTDFIIDSAQAAARRIIAEYDTMRLAMRDREVFVNALLQPPAPSQRLRRAAKRYKGASRL